jgi:hypothetical protein
LKGLPYWSGGESVGLSYWNLIADLSRLIETELTDRGINGDGLRKKILTGLCASPIPGFASYVNNLHRTYPIGSWTDFNTHFSTLKSQISDPADTKEHRIITAAYLAGVTRNQVQHQVEKQMVIFVDREAAAFTVDALLALCRFDGWLP